MAAAQVFLVELGAYDPGIPGVITLRYASKRGHTTTPAEAPASTIYDARIIQPADISRDLFAGIATMGAARVGYGDLILDNKDGALDALINYGFDGRVLTVRQGDEGAAYPAGFPVVFVGTQEQAVFDADSITIKVRDRILEVQLPLQTNRYLGNNALPAGLEGIASDLKDKPKPVVLGRVRNFSMPCVNTSKLIYQANDGAISSINAVRDNGVLLGISPYGLAKVAHGKGGFDGRAIAEDGAGHLVVGGGDYALGYTGWILYGDGTAWTKVTPAVFNKHFIEALAFGAGVFVAVGSQRNGVGVAPAIATSADFGATWTTRTAPASWGTGDSFILSVRWLAGINRFCITTSTGKIAISADGITWTDAGIATGSVLWDSGTDGTIIFVVGTNAGLSYLLKSTDVGVTFAAATTAGLTGTELQCIYYANKMWVLGGIDVYSSVWTSPDGVAWTRRFNGTVTGSSNLFDVYYSSGWWMIGASSSNLVSRDGIIWFNDSPGSGYGGAFSQIVFGGRWWVSGEHGYAGDNGVAASPSPVAYANNTDLLDDTLKPPIGSYGVCVSTGFVRLGAKPEGLITADITEGAAVGDRKPGTMFTRLLGRAGKVGADWSAGDVVTADALGYILGYAAGVEEAPNVDDVLDFLAQSIGGWWGLDKSGIYRIKQLIVPAGASVAAITENDIKGKPKRLATSDTGHGLPVYRVTMRHSKNYTVQTDGVAPIVLDADRALFAVEWQTEKAETVGVKTKHLLSPEITIDTMLTLAADAATEAARIQTLRGTRRDPYEVIVEMNTETNLMDLGSVVDFTYAPNGITRYGITGPKKMLVLVVQPNAQKQECTLTLWG